MKFLTIPAAALVGSFMILGTSNVSANEDINPWQHCGIGAAIFDDNETAAALSNVIWDLGTTEVTSATIPPDTCNGQNVNVAKFVDATYEQLAMETAMGDGEHLSAALDLMNCGSDSSASVMTQLRSDLEDASAATGCADQAHADKAFQYCNSLNQAAADCTTS